MRRPLLGELLGLAFVNWGHRASASSQESVGSEPSGLLLGLGRDALGLSHLTLIGTLVRTTV